MVRVLSELQQNLYKRRLHIFERGFEIKKVSFLFIHNTTNFFNIKGELRV